MLGLGIGANTAIFSAINAVLLKPLPYQDGSRLVVIRQSAPAQGRADTGVSIKEYFDYREQSREFDALVEYHQMSFDLLRRGEPDRVDTGVVSHNFFETIGINPLHGRTFRESDDRPGADAVLVLSHRYWQSKFGGDPGVVGQILEMNDRPHTVVGILPDVPLYPQENDVYMPVLACPFRAAAERNIAQNRRVFAALNIFGRVKPGVAVGSAAAAVEGICGRFTKDNPAAYQRLASFQATTVAVQDALTQNARPMLLALLGTTGLVLLLACANVANLTIARLLRRERELAVRSALGAGRGRVLRQLLTESTMLALAGAAVGLVVASATMGLLRQFVARFTDRADEITIDPWVLTFTVLVALTTGILFGIMPGLVSRTDLSAAIKQGERGSGEAPARRRLQSALVVAQVALSVVLLAGAALLLASLFRLQRVDPGYRSDGVLSAFAAGNFSKYPDAQSLLRIYQPLVERLEQLPGVQSAAITTAVPFTAAAPGNVQFLIEGMANDDQATRPSTDLRIASPRYFETLGIPLIGGRTFGDGDHAQAPPVVVINQAATRHWRGRDPVGTRVSFDNGQTWRTVVGIAGNIRQFGLEREVPPQIYVPMRQTPFGFAGRILVRTAGDPSRHTRAVIDAVHALDPDMPVEDVETLADLRSESLTAPRTVAILLSMFALLALAVTLSGVAGVLATSVAQRTREFGIRMALGEERGQVLRGVVRRGMVLVGIGLALGIVGAAFASQILASYLYATPALDPWPLALVVTTFVVAGLLACLGPALRATRVDPMTALRD
jgi:putative ABC transport system permease protein